MCGRYVSSSPPDELARYFDAAPPPEGVSLPAAYNVAPTADVWTVVCGSDGVRRLEVLRWGLIPVWAKDVKIGSKMINARSETLAGKGAFKPAFTKRRCIVPADGFFEWKDLGTPAGAKKALKQPMFIHRLDGEPLAFAGLWETWRDRNVEAAADAAAAEILRTTTIITTAANATMAPVHDRMPVILPASAWDEWLDPSNHDLTRLGRLLVPAPDGLLTMHPVSTAVNSVRNRGPELLEPVEPLAPATAAIGPPAPPESELPL